MAPPRAPDLFTAIGVTFSWWHVNSLGVGLHNYGFTAGKNTIWPFYACMGAVLISGKIKEFAGEAAVLAFRDVISGSSTWFRIKSP